MKTWLASLACAALCATGLASVAVAQDPVEARHEAMEEIGDANRPMRRMFSGEAAYDEATVRDSANLIASLAGDDLIALFPEGSGSPESDALPAIWENWAEFEELAMRLQTVAEGLALAAGNTEAAAANETSMGALMGGPAPAAETEITVQALAEMPASDVFEMLGDTCGACHSKFRAKRN
ncbi:cytochrome c [Acuticoccus sp. M5D2P5]|uniref:c-type cytochrome n=1 Tax=Acuticoccus kalidii TaxID=2910977 RepID=UPI001F30AE08|nr:cytochrome c [Acuticoccus kalidii]MCF3936190.1 cytochrome c [Acuticoccus kalidii]